jgi:F-type H+-transporting ATPase subunit a
LFTAKHPDLAHILVFKFEEQPVYKGFYIAKEGKYKDKIVEIDENGKEVRPLDISLTKTATALIFNSVLLIILIMSIAHYYKKDGIFPKKGFVILMEMLIMDIYEGVVKPSIGKDYRRYAPYLLTVFFFIFLNNLMGLIPFFPFGATVTGNIAITLTLALCSLLVLLTFRGRKNNGKKFFGLKCLHGSKFLFH